MYKRIENSNHTDQYTAEVSTTTRYGKNVVSIYQGEATADWSKKEIKQLVAALTLALEEMEGRA